MAIFLMMLLGPSTSGLVLTAVLDGRQGLRELWGRMTRWRVGPQWWAIALLTVPMLLLVLLSVLSRVVSPAFAPGLQLVGLAFGLVAGFFEEIGWTGYATPRLLNRYNVLMAGFLLGVLWALWHTLADFSGNFNTMGAGWLPWIIIYWLVPLTAYRILMTWVYANTKSVLLAQLMHASYTGWLLTLSPAGAFSQSLVWQAAFAASLWAIVAAVAVLNRKQRISERAIPA